jgi:hypothetical protein
MNKIWCKHSGGNTHFYSQQSSFFLQWQILKKTNLIVRKERNNPDNLFPNILFEQTAQELKQCMKGLKN